MLLLAVLLSYASAAVQTYNLPYTPGPAAYSRHLDRLILGASSPPRLELFDPTNGTSQAIALPAAPLGLSASPDGRRAAVGHAGSITLVDLETRTIQRTYTVTGNVDAIVLAAEWIYAPLVGGSFSVNIATGAVTPGPALIRTFASGGLHASGKYLYGGSGEVYRIDVSTGPMTVLTYASFFDEFLNYGRPILPSASLPRVYSSSVIFSRSDTAAIDLGYLQELPIGGTALAESDAGLVAVLGASNFAFATSPRNGVRLYDPNTLAQVGQYALTGTLQIPPGGRFPNLYFNQANTALVALVRLDPATGALYDHAVQYIPFAQPDCTGYAGRAVSVPGGGGHADFALQAPNDSCTYQLTSDAAWLRIVSNASGSGSNVIRMHARPNVTTGARTATVKSGAQVVFTVTQEPRGGASPAPLGVQVVDAAYIESEDRVLLAATNPEELHVYDPIARTSEIIPLTYAPQSVAVSPDGQFAAVGHGLGFVTYVNLRTRTVERVYPTGTMARDIVLPGNGYGYWVTAFQGAELVGMSLASGMLTRTPTNTSILTPTLSVAPTGGYLYTGARPARWDVQAGAPRRAATWPPSPFASGSCSDIVGVAQDGRRLFLRCGVLRLSDRQADDGIAEGVLESVVNLQAVADSRLRKRLAVLPSIAGASPYRSVSDELRLYDDDLALRGRLPLTSIATNGGLVRPVGEYVFWSRAGDKLFVVSRGDLDRAEPQVYALETVAPESISNCSVTLAPPVMMIGPEGGRGSFPVRAAGDCLWAARAPERILFYPPTGTFLELTSMLVGRGETAVNFELPANSSSAPVIHTVRVNDKTMTLLQPAVNGVAAVMDTTQFVVEGGLTTLRVYAASSVTPWSVQASAPWVTVSQISAFGTAAIVVTVAPNTGPTARAATLQVGTQTFTLHQSAAVTNGLRFVPVAPCRVADTRTVPPPLLPTFVLRNSRRDFAVADSNCGIPPTASAYSLNVTAIPKFGSLGYLTMWPAGQPMPLASTLNSLNGQIVANAAVTPAGDGGRVSVYVTDDADIVIDINGYFTP